MSFWFTVTSTRTTTPDPVATLAAVRTACSDAALQISFSLAPDYTIKKTLDIAAGDQAAALAAIDGAPALTPQRQARNEFDNIGIREQAEMLVILDEINLLRAALSGLGVANMTARTRNQFVNAIKNKADTLS